MGGGRDKINENDKANVVSTNIEEYRRRAYGNSFTILQLFRIYKVISQ